MNHLALIKAHGDAKDHSVVARGVVQRKCDKCGKKKPHLQSAAIRSAPESVRPTVNDVLRSSGRSLNPSKRTFMEPRFEHDFSQVRVHTDAKAAESARVMNGDNLRPARLHADVSDMPSMLHTYDGKSDCSPTWFGDTSPEVDANGGSFTGKLIVKYNDAALKSPCVRECVEQHEAVHVMDLTPIVKRIHDCDVAAGNDWDKKDRCNEMATRELAETTKRSECQAYRTSFTCLTLKILDASSPCSKPPHRDEVQKHRKYEACEMKRHCAEAGTPKAGIPNV